MPTSTSNAITSNAISKYLDSVKATAQSENVTAISPTRSVIALP